MDTVGEFFTALPEVARLLWTFGEGFYGVAVTLGSVVLFVALCWGAAKLRDGHGWLSATLGSTAAFIGLWWLTGILPSAWFYFASGEVDFLADRVIPASLPGLDNFFDVFRDTIVVIITAVGMIAIGMTMARVQRKYPRGLAEGEEKGAASGGYK